MTISMWTPALVRARDAWEEQTEALRGARRNLAQAEPRLLGDAVGPAAEAFLSTWESRVTRLRDRAEGHADALAQTLYDTLITDQRSVEDTQQLLLWDDRNAIPGGGL